MVCGSLNKLLMVYFFHLSRSSKNDLLLSYFNGRYFERRTGYLGSRVRLIILEKKLYKIVSLFGTVLRLYYSTNNHEILRTCCQKSRKIHRILEFY